MNATEETIFNAALDKQDRADRAAYLEQACAGDAELKSRIEKLVAAYAGGAFLESPAAGLAATTHQEPQDSPGKLIGPYKLLQVIGEGGMGVVYMAEQLEPVERKVALKIIKPGMDSRQVIARFEAERQALALMDHPNIAKVLDAGRVGQASSLPEDTGQAGRLPHAGRPYFVMELVKGVPITKYCDEKHLSLKERLELMIPVCQALQHAHQKGIIHRDIKPTNVLVAQYDGRPVPKVIDFGIAKATAQKLTERTMFTEFGQLVGTLEYMSPEQAELNQLDIDTRSDVYSLGVLLYELLTGSTPFDKQKLRTAAFQEMLRIIREDEPEKPSTRLSRVRETHQSSSSQTPSAMASDGTRSVPTTSLASIAAVRATEPARLTKDLRGELDWIVMKALEKDRSRRYETANGFALDLQRYLHDEQVLACPASAAYRFRKFARRHRVAFTTTGVVAMSLLIATAISVWQAIEANSARKLADDRLVLANRSLVSEKEARTEAENQRRHADAARQEAEVNFKKALEAVDRMLTRVGDESLHDVPQMEQIQKRLFQDAVEFYEGFLRQRAMDPKLQYEAAQSYMRVVGAKFGQGDEKQKALHHAKELFTQLHAENPDDINYVLGLARTYTWLGWGSADGAPEQLEHFRRAHELLLGMERKMPPNRLPEFRYDLGTSYANLGGALAYPGHFEESEALFKKALELDAGHHGFALMLVKVGRHTEAIDYMAQAVQQRQKQIEGTSKWRIENQLTYADSCHALGKLLAKANRREEAVTYFQTAAAIREQVASDFPSTTRYQDWASSSRIELFDAKERGQLPLSTQDLENALRDMSLEIEKKPTPWYLYKRRAVAHFHLGHFDAALADIAKAIELEPQDSSNLFWIAPSLVAACPDEHFRAGMLALADKAVGLTEGFKGNLASRGELYAAQKKWERAQADFEQALAIDPNYTRVQKALAKLKEEQAKDQDGEP